MLLGAFRAQTTAEDKKVTNSQDDDFVGGLEYNWLNMPTRRSKKSQALGDDKFCGKFDEKTLNNLARYQRPGLSLAGTAELICAIDTRACFRRDFCGP
jgi:hypothetical protein